MSKFLKTECSLGHSKKFKKKFLGEAAWERETYGYAVPSKELGGGSWPAAKEILHSLSPFWEFLCVFAGKLQNVVQFYIRNHFDISVDN